MHICKKWNQWCMYCWLGLRYSDQSPQGMLYDLFIELIFPKGNMGYFRDSIEKTVPQDTVSPSSNIIS